MSTPSRFSLLSRPGPPALVPITESTSHLTLSTIARRSPEYQIIATLDLVLVYQLIIVLPILLLVGRNLTLKWKRSSRERSLVSAKYLAEGETGLPLSAGSGRFEIWLLRPVDSKWACGLANRLQVAVWAWSLVVNTAFILIIDTDFQGARQSAAWNKIHLVALRCGYMSLAQLPAVFAFMGRNSLVHSLTGIHYQHLRFIHKLLARWCILLGVLHTLEATVAELVWSGASAVANLYQTYLGITGSATLVGFSLLGVFSIRKLRMSFYELFLICHVAGAIVMLVALCYHVPSLGYWLYISAGFWAYERLLRILQAFPSHFSPVVQAEATLVDGGIILNVPTRKRWTSGQHSYITICDPSFPLSANLQPHPFSIANLAPADGSADTVNNMRFIIKVRDGMTSKIARALSNAPGNTRSVWVAAEGPYGSRVRTEEFQELLLVAGGSGISHCMSVLAEANSRRPSETRRVTLVWTVQTRGQLNWAIPSLLCELNTASKSGIILDIHLFYTRDNSPSSSQNGVMNTSEKALPLPAYTAIPLPTSMRAPSPVETLFHELSQRTDITLSPGRPPLAAIVRDFAAGAAGRSLVTTCGPSPMTSAVAQQVSNLAHTHPVSLDLAVFEC